MEVVADILESKRRDKVVPKSLLAPEKMGLRSLCVALFLVFHVCISVIKRISLDELTLSEDSCQIIPAFHSDILYYDLECPEDTSSAKLYFSSKYGDIYDEDGWTVGSSVLSSDDVKDKRIYVCSPSDKFKSDKCTEYHFTFSTLYSTTPSIQQLSFSHSTSPLSPSFDPSTYSYTIAFDPYEQIQVTAISDKSSLVSFESFAKALSHEELLVLPPSDEEGEINIYVVSLDGKKETQYTIKYTYVTAVTSELLPYDGITLSGAAFLTPFHSSRNFFQAKITAFLSNNISITLKPRGVCKAQILDRPEEVITEKSFDITIPKLDNEGHKQDVTPFVVPITISCPDAEPRLYTIHFQKEFESILTDDAYGNSLAKVPNLLLKGLQIYGAVLHESFHPLRLTYSGMVSSDQHAIAFKAESYDEDAVITVNKKELGRNKTPTWFGIKKGEVKNFTLEIKKGEVHVFYVFSIIRVTSWWASETFATGFSSFSKWSNILFTLTNLNSLLDTAKFFQFISMVNSIKGLPSTYDTYSNVFQDLSISNLLSVLIEGSDDDVTIDGEEKPSGEEETDVIDHKTVEQKNSLIDELRFEAQDALSAVAGESKENPSDIIKKPNSIKDKTFDITDEILLEQPDLIWPVNTYIEASLDGHILLKDVQTRFDSFDFTRKRIFDSSLYLTSFAENVLAHHYWKEIYELELGSLLHKPITVTTTPSGVIETNQATTSSSSYIAIDRSRVILYGNLSSALLHLPWNPPDFTDAYDTLISDEQKDAEEYLENLQSLFVNAGLAIVVSIVYYFIYRRTNLPSSEHRNIAAKETREGTTSDSNHPIFGSKYLAQESYISLQLAPFILFALDLMLIPCTTSAAIVLFSKVAVENHAVFGIAIPVSVAKGFASLFLLYPLLFIVFSFIKLTQLYKHVFYSEEMKSYIDKKIYYLKGFFAPASVLSIFSKEVRGIIPIIPLNSKAEIESKNDFYGPGVNFELGKILDPLKGLENDKTGDLVLDTINFCQKSSLKLDKPGEGEGFVEGNVDIHEERVSEYSSSYTLPLINEYKKRDSDEDNSVYQNIKEIVDNIFDDVDTVYIKKGRVSGDIEQRDTDVFRRRSSFASVYQPLLHDLPEESGAGRHFNAYCEKQQQIKSIDFFRLYAHEKKKNQYKDVSYRLDKFNSFLSTHHGSEKATSSLDLPSPTLELPPLIIQKGSSINSSPLSANPAREGLFSQLEKYESKVIEITQQMEDSQKKLAENEILYDTDEQELLVRFNYIASVTKDVENGIPSILEHNKELYNNERNEYYVGFKRYNVLNSYFLPIDIRIKIPVHLIKKLITNLKDSFWFNAPLQCLQQKYMDTWSFFFLENNTCSPMHFFTTRVSSIVIIFFISTFKAGTGLTQLCAFFVIQLFLWISLLYSEMHNQRQDTKKSISDAPFDLSGKDKPDDTLDVDENDKEVYLLTGVYSLSDKMVEFLNDRIQKTILFHLLNNALKNRLVEEGVSCNEASFLIELVNYISDLSKLPIEERHQYVISNSYNSKFSTEKIISSDFWKKNQDSLRKQIRLINSMINYVFVSKLFNIQEKDILYVNGHTNIVDCHQHSRVLRNEIHISNYCGANNLKRHIGDISKNTLEQSKYKYPPLSLAGGSFLDDKSQSFDPVDHLAARVTNLLQNKTQHFMTNLEEMKGINNDADVKSFVRELEQWLNGQQFVGTMKSSLLKLYVINEMSSSPLGFNINRLISSSGTESMNEFFGDFKNYYENLNKMESTCFAETKHFNELYEQSLKNLNAQTISERGTISSVAPSGDIQNYFERLSNLSQAKEEYRVDLDVETGEGIVGMDEEGVFKEERDIRIRLQEESKKGWAYRFFSFINPLFNSQVASRSVFPGQDYAYESLESGDYNESRTHNSNGVSTPNGTDNFFRFQPYKEEDFNLSPVWLLKSLRRIIYWFDGGKHEAYLEWCSRLNEKERLAHQNSPMKGVGYVLTKGKIISEIDIVPNSNHLQKSSFLYLVQCECPFSKTTFYCVKEANDLYQSSSFVSKEYTHTKDFELALRQYALQSLNKTNKRYIILSTNTKKKEEVNGMVNLSFKSADNEKNQDIFDAVKNYVLINVLGIKKDIFDDNYIVDALACMLQNKVLVLFWSWVLLFVLLLTHKSVQYFDVDFGAFIAMLCTFMVFLTMNYYSSIQFFEGTIEWIKSSADDIKSSIMEVVDAIKKNSPIKLYNLYKPKILHKIYQVIGKDLLSDITACDVIVSNKHMQMLLNNKLNQLCKEIKILFALQVILPTAVEQYQDDERDEAKNRKEKLKKKGVNSKWSFGCFKNNVAPEKISWKDSFGFPIGIMSIFFSLDSTTQQEVLLYTRTISNSAVISSIYGEAFDNYKEYIRSVLYEKNLVRIRKDVKGSWILSLLRYIFNKYHHSMLKTSAVQINGMINQLMGGNALSILEDITMASSDEISAEDSIPVTVKEEVLNDSGSTASKEYNAIYSYIYPYLYPYSVGMSSNKNDTNEDDVDNESNRDIEIRDEPSFYSKLLSCCGVESEEQSALYNRRKKYQEINKMRKAYIEMTPAYSAFLPEDFTLYNNDEITASLYHAPGVPLDNVPLVVENNQSYKDRYYYVLCLFCAQAQFLARHYSQLYAEEKKKYRLSSMTEETSVEDINLYVNELGIKLEGEIDWTTASKQKMNLLSVDEKKKSILYVKKIKSDAIVDRENDNLDVVLSAKEFIQGREAKLNRLSLSISALSFSNESFYNAVNTILSQVDKINNTASHYSTKFVQEVYEGVHDICRSFFVNHRLVPPNKSQKTLPDTDQRVARELNVVFNTANVEYFMGPSQASTSVDCFVWYDNEEEKCMYMSKKEYYGARAAIEKKGNITSAEDTILMNTVNSAKKKGNAIPLESVTFKSFPLKRAKKIVMKYNFPTSTEVQMMSKDYDVNNLVLHNSLNKGQCLLPTYEKAQASQKKEVHCVSREFFVDREKSVTVLDESNQPKHSKQEAATSNITKAAVDLSFLIPEYMNICSLSRKINFMTQQGKRRPLVLKMDIPSKKVAVSTDGNAEAISSVYCVIKDYTYEVKKVYHEYLYLLHDEVTEQHYLWRILSTTGKELYKLFYTYVFTTLWVYYCHTFNALYVYSMSKWDKFYNQYVIGVLPEEDGKNELPGQDATNSLHGGDDFETSSVYTNTMDKRMDANDDVSSVLSYTNSVLSDVSRASTIDKRASKSIESHLMRMRSLEYDDAKWRTHVVKNSSLIGNLMNGGVMGYENLDQVSSNKELRTMYQLRKNNELKQYSIQRVSILIEYIQKMQNDEKWFYKYKDINRYSFDFDAQQQNMEAWIPCQIIGPKIETRSSDSSSSVVYDISSRLVVSPDYRLTLKKMREDCKGVKIMKCFSFFLSSKTLIFLPIILVNDLYKSINQDDNFHENDAATYFNKSTKEFESLLSRYQQQCIEYKINKKYSLKNNKGGTAEKTNLATSNRPCELNSCGKTVLKRKLAVKRSNHFDTVLQFEQVKSDLLYIQDDVTVLKENIDLHKEFFTQLGNGYLMANQEKSKKRKYFLYDTCPLFSAFEDTNPFMKRYSSFIPSIRRLWNVCFYILHRLHGVENIISNGKEQHPDTIFKYISFLLASEYMTKEGNRLSKYAERLSTAINIKREKTNKNGKPVLEISSSMRYNILIILKNMKTPLRDAFKSYINLKMKDTEEQFSTFKKYSKIFNDSTCSAFGEEETGKNQASIGNHVNEGIVKIKANGEAYNANDLHENAEEDFSLQSTNIVMGDYVWNNSHLKSEIFGETAKVKTILSLSVYDILDKSFDNSLLATKERLKNKGSFLLAPRSSISLNQVQAIFNPRSYGTCMDVITIFQSGVFILTCLKQYQSLYSLYYGSVEAVTGDLILEQFTQEAIMLSYRMHQAFTCLKRISLVHYKKKTFVFGDILSRWIESDSLNLDTGISFDGNWYTSLYGRMKDLPLTQNVINLLYKNLIMVLRTFFPHLELDNEDSMTNKQKNGVHTITKEAIDFSIEKLNKKLETVLWYKKYVDEVLNLQVELVSAQRIRSHRIWEEMESKYSNFVRRYPAVDSAWPNKSRKAIFNRIRKNREIFYFKNERKQEVAPAGPQDLIDINLEGEIPELKENQAAAIVEEVAEKEPTATHEESSIATRQMNIILKCKFEKQFIIRWKQAHVYDPSHHSYRGVREDMVRILSDWTSQLKIWRSQILTFCKKELAIQSNADFLTDRILDTVVKASATPENYEWGIFKPIIHYFINPSSDASASTTSTAIAATTAAAVGSVNTANITLRTPPVLKTFEGKILLQVDLPMKKGTANSSMLVVQDCLVKILPGLIRFSISYLNTSKKLIYSHVSIPLKSLRCISCSDNFLKGKMENMNKKGSIFHLVLEEGYVVDNILEGGDTSIEINTPFIQRRHKINETTPQYIDTILLHAKEMLDIEYEEKFAGNRIEDQSVEGSSVEEMLRNTYYTEDISTADDVLAGSIYVQKSSKKKMNFNNENSIISNNSTSQHISLYVPNDMAVLLWTVLKVIRFDISRSIRGYNGNTILLDDIPSSQRYKGLLPTEHFDTRLRDTTTSSGSVNSLSTSQIYYRYMKHVNAEIEKRYGGLFKEKELEEGEKCVLMEINASTVTSSPLVVKKDDFTYQNENGLQIEFCNYKGEWMMDHYHGKGVITQLISPSVQKVAAPTGTAAQAERENVSFYQLSVRPFFQIVYNGTFKLGLRHGNKCTMNYEYLQMDGNTIWMEYQGDYHYDFCKSQNASLRILSERAVNQIHQKLLSKQQDHAELTDKIKEKKHDKDNGNEESDSEDESDYSSDEQETLPMIDDDTVSVISNISTRSNPNKVYSENIKKMQANEWDEALTLIHTIQGKFDAFGSSNPSIPSQDVRPQAYDPKSALYQLQDQDIMAKQPGCSEEPYALDALMPQLYRWRKLYLDDPLVLQDRYRLYLGSIEKLLKPNMTTNLHSVEKHILLSRLYLYKKNVFEWNSAHHITSFERNYQLEPLEDVINNTSTIIHPFASLIDSNSRIKYINGAEYTGSVYKSIPFGEGRLSFPLFNGDCLEISGNWDNFHPVSLPYNIKKMRKNGKMLFEPSNLTVVLLKKQTKEKASNPWRGSFAWIGPVSKDLRLVGKGHVYEMSARDTFSGMTMKQIKMRTTHLKSQMLSVPEVGIPLLEMYDPSNSLFYPGGLPLEMRNAENGVAVWYKGTYPCEVAMKSLETLSPTLYEKTALETLIADEGSRLLLEINSLIERLIKTPIGEQNSNTWQTMSQVMIQTFLKELRASFDEFEKISITRSERNFDTRAMFELYPVLASSPSDSTKSYHHTTVVSDVGEIHLEGFSQAYTTSQARPGVQNGSFRLLPATHVSAATAKDVSSLYSNSVKSFNGRVDKGVPFFAQRLQLKENYYYCGYLYEGKLDGFGVIYDDKNRPLFLGEFKKGGVYGLGMILNSEDNFMPSYFGIFERGRMVKGMMTPAIVTEEDERQTLQYYGSVGTGGQWSAEGECMIQYKNDRGVVVATYVGEVRKGRRNGRGVYTKMIQVTADENKLTQLVLDGIWTDDAYSGEALIRQDANILWSSSKGIQGELLKSKKGLLSCLPGGRGFGLGDVEDIVLGKKKSINYGSCEWKVSAPVQKKFADLLQCKPLEVSFLFNFNNLDISLVKSFDYAFLMLRQWILTCKKYLPFKKYGAALQKEFFEREMGVFNEQLRQQKEKKIDWLNAEKNLWKQSLAIGIDNPNAKESGSNSEDEHSEGEMPL